MVLLVTPLLKGLKVARRAAPDAIQADDEVTVEDNGETWVFEFIPQGDSLGGGARVTIIKEGLRVQSVVRGQ